MKAKLLTLLAVVVAFAACTKSNTIQVSNPLEVDRPDETIVLTRTDIEAKFGIVEKGMAPVVLFKNKNIPSQVDDMDGDKIWDELVFTLHFNASEVKELSINFVALDQYPEFEKRTNVRLGIMQDDGSYKEFDTYSAPDISEGFKIIAQGESASWENDKMAFRNYLDVRNIKDLFGKLKPDLMLENISTPKIPSYHKLMDWGMDVLHCGSSLGAGGLAMMEGDSLYRLGSTQTYTYQKVAEGPVRSVFDLNYTGWNVADKMLEATERISIVPGKYWFTSDVTVKGSTPGMQLITGIVTSRLDNEPFNFMANDDFKTLATHDKQTEIKDELGMAVMIPANEAGITGRTTDINYYNEGYKTVDEKGFSHVISETCYIAQKIEDKEPARHYFFSVWGRENQKWKDVDNFKTYISEQADLLSNPICVKY